ncbi:Fanconi-associated nuclease 1 [BD1-7 clade bacterium]|uniref:phosphodiesterase I n=1 Tax=BD1-7 clade bacterium TaxID=2029982 RepID=A0A5S9PZC8_9GAMM|nr:Fanconi-associated nuclease 1 [BD1-7 clade bacterium]CAA0110155.1 Fanconi-associated nuclease 1 [BD1-7 clade bacterium]
MATAPLPALDTGYYLRNFDTLVAFVKSSYADILPVETLTLIDTYQSLTTPAQALYVRLLMRKGELFRCDKLAYDEIPDQPQAIDELCQHQLLERVSSANTDLSERLMLLTKPELVTLGKVCGTPIASSARKPDWVDHLVASAEHDAADHVDRQKSLDVLLEESYPMIRQAGLAMVDQIKLCFFGNRYQDLSEFVISELGVVTYENYALDNDHRFYHSTQQLLNHDRYYQLLASADDIREMDAEALVHLCESMPEKTDAVLQRRVERTITRAARQLERLGELHSARDWFAKTRQPPARERIVRISAALKEWPAAKAMLNDIQARPIDDDEAEFAQRFIPKVQKALGEPIQKYTAPEIITNTLTCDFVEGERVEQRVQTVLTDEDTGSVCLYVENLLFNALFGLYFWDDIFAPVPQAFINPFHRGPLDLFSPDFYIRRTQSIDQRLAYLLECPSVDKSGNKSGDKEENLSSEKTILLSQLLATAQQKAGIANHFVVWEYATPELLTLAVETIPSEDLHAIFQRMLADLRNNRSGFPDLIRFDPQGYELIEVKGPGDRLQKNQIRWLNYFSDHGIPARVLHVEWGSV